MPVPVVVATEPEQGWLLLADAGEPLRQLVRLDGNVGRWQTAVSHYAQMQIALIPRAATLLALGVFDRRLARLPTLFAELLQDIPAMLIGHEEGLTVAEYDQLQQAIPRFGAMCQQLAAFGIPETLHHDDFHDNNVFVKNGRYTFADWGEACLAHPFFSMIIVLRIAAHILKLDADAPALASLRDLYLAQWQAYGTLDELQAAFRLAQTVGTVNRALTWHALLTLMSDAERAADADAVPRWLQSFLSLL
jgi:aminoglycoside/choline kinase family phosphotransferase